MKKYQTPEIELFTNKNSDVIMVSNDEDNALFPDNFGSN